MALSIETELVRRLNIYKKLNGTYRFFLSKMREGEPRNTDSLGKVLVKFSTKEVTSRLGDQARGIKGTIEMEVMHSSEEGIMAIGLDLEKNLPSLIVLNGRNFALILVSPCTLRVSTAGVVSGILTFKYFF